MPRLAAERAHVNHNCHADIRVLLNWHLGESEHVLSGNAVWDRRRTGGASGSGCAPGRPMSEELLLRHGAVCLAGLDSRVDIARPS